jgi:hypothetical protein
MPHPRSGRKQCTRCKEWKTWDVDDKHANEFKLSKRKNVDGSVRVYPAGECKACGNQRAAEYREKLRKEGELAERQRKWNANRDPEHRKRYQREYQREQRRREGIPERGPWKRYRNEAPTLVPIEPLRAWLLAHIRETGAMHAELEARASLPANTIKNLLHPHRTLVDLELADEILYAAGAEGKLRELYPLEG